MTVSLPTKTNPFRSDPTSASFVPRVCCLGYWYSRSNKLAGADLALPAPTRPAAAKRLEEHRQLTRQYKYGTVTVTSISWQPYIYIHNMNRNNTNGTSSSMGHESIMAHSSNNNAYSGETWTSMSPYSQSPYSTSPLTDYGSFAPYVSHGMPVESTNRMPPPPPHQMISRQPSMGHHHHHHHPPLPMLNTTWPSQLTNPTPSGSYSAPPLSVIIPASGAPPVEAPRLPTPHEKARKTLSTEQKRAMCQFHEDNPGTRQADIGARFGVERR